MADDSDSITSTPFSFRDSSDKEAFVKVAVQVNNEYKNLVCYHACMYVRYLHLHRYRNILSEKIFTKEPYTICVVIVEK